MAFLFVYSIVIPKNGSIAPGAVQIQSKKTLWSQRVSFLCEQLHCVLMAKINPNAVYQELYQKNHRLPFGRSDLIFHQKFLFYNEYAVGEICT